MYIHLIPQAFITSVMLIKSFSSIQAWEHFVETRLACVCTNACGRYALTFLTRAVRYPGYPRLIDMTPDPWDDAEFLSCMRRMCNSFMSISCLAKAYGAGAVHGYFLAIVAEVSLWRPAA